jgi:predicted dehydrogenase
MELDTTNLFMQVSWNDRKRRRILEIAGSDRSAQIECVDQEITVYSDNDTEPITVDKNNTIRDEAENFVEAILTGKNTFNSAIVGARTVDEIATIEEEITDD